MFNYVKYGLGWLKPLTRKAILVKERVQLALHPRGVRQLDGEGEGERSRVAALQGREPRPRVVRDTDLDLPRRRPNEVQGHRGGAGLGVEGLRLFDPFGAADPEGHLLGAGHRVGRILHPTEPLPADYRPVRVHLLGHCLLCGLYVVPEALDAHAANCHPDVPVAVSRLEVN